VEISKSIPIIFPAHLRTQKQIKAFGIEHYFDYSSSSHQPGKIRLIDPLGYLDFLKLMSNASVVFSDSGGIQEETTILGVPCMTIRENTERPITITQGTNRLVGTQLDNIITLTKDLLKSKKAPARTPALWDGEAAERAIRILVSKHDV